MTPIRKFRRYGSENLAREYWHNPSPRSANASCVSTKDEWRENHGVVGDVHDEGVSKPATTIVYWPLMMDHFRSDDSMSMREVAFVHPQLAHWLGKFLERSPPGRFGR